MKKHLSILALSTLSMLGIVLICLSGCQPNSEKSETPKIQKPTTMDPGMNMDKSGAVGLTILEDSSGFKAGTESLAFKLTDGAHGTTLTKFEKTHGKPLHFVVVDEALADFQHLHPIMADDGTWTQNVTFANGGRYLAFADGKVGRASFAARQEIAVEGSPRKETSDFVVSNASKIGDVSATIIDPNTFSTDIESIVRLKLSRPDGWQPYLEAPGHLILIRKEGDEFIHAHPAEDMKDGVVEFMADFKKPGTYRAWAQFQRQDKVLTFPFTINVGASTAKDSKPMDIDHKGH